MHTWKRRRVGGRVEKEEKKDRERRVRGKVRGRERVRAEGAGEGRREIERGRRWRRTARYRWAGLQFTLKHSSHKKWRQVYTAMAGASILFPFNTSFPYTTRTPSHAR